MIELAVIDADGNVVNRVVVADLSQWSPPDQCMAVEGLYQIGGTLIAGVYTPPPAPSLPLAAPATSVTPRQARLALLQAGLLDQVESAVKAADSATKITWEFATQINRGDPLITQIGLSLNLTEAQIDGLFVTASKL